MKSIGENDPRHARMRRIRADGSIAPFSLEEQWQQVANWHELLEHERKDAESPYNGFNAAWDVILSEGHTVNERGQNLSATAPTPIETLSYMLEMGFYPPPELLMAIIDCFDAYMANGGRITLEEAFFGRPMKSAGNYAKRRSSRSRNLALKMEFIGFLSEGHSRIEAAEKVSVLLDGRVDADSILRMMRGVGKRLPKKQDSAENKGA